MLYNVPNFSFFAALFPVAFLDSSKYFTFCFLISPLGFIDNSFHLFCKQQGSNLSDMEHMCNIGKLGFATSVHLLWLYSLVCVGSARKFGRQFSRSLAQMEVFPLSPYLYVTKDVLRLKMSDLVK